PTSRPRAAETGRIRKAGVYVDASPRTRLSRIPEEARKGTAAGDACERSSREACTSTVRRRTRVRFFELAGGKSGDRPATGSARRRILRSLRRRECRRRARTIEERSQPCARAREGHHGVAPGD